MLDKAAKKRIIKRFATKEGDTGSTEVQIAILSYEIKDLSEHLKIHKKDHSSRRGLLRKIGERRRLLKYLNKENRPSWEVMVKRLRLKQARELEKPTEEELAAMEADEKAAA